MGRHQSDPRDLRTEDLIGTPWAARSRVSVFVEYEPMARDKRVIFTVRGRGAFPIDMLRYDQCKPADPDLILKVRYDQSVEIQMVSLDGRVTVDRWRSFGWGCVIDGPIEDVTIRKSDPNAECDVCKMWNRQHPSGCQRPGLPILLI